MSIAARRVDKLATLYNLLDTDKLSKDEQAVIGYLKRQQDAGRAVILTVSDQSLIEAAYQRNYPEE